MNLHELVELMRAEFNEMPGLRLTLRQAQRLWGVDSALCSSAMRVLEQASFLRRAAGDFYVKAA
jgi:hypothetical protein